MSIRHTLLISYLLISLSSALLIAFLIFTQVRKTLYTEIETKLQTQASIMMQHIDTTLFERMQNITTWSRLDTMQEIRTRDVDKRLSQFLDELHTGYDGVYQQLLATDRKQEIIASSDQKLINQRLLATEAWLQFSMNSQTLSLLPLDLLNKRLYFSIPIPDNFQNGELGTLYTGFDWSEIFHLLTTSMPLAFDNQSSYAVLVDAQRRIIAHSEGLENKISTFSVLPDHWPSQNQNGTFSTRLGFLNNSEALVGYAQSTGYRSFKGFGWRVYIIQPNEHAFASIWQLWQTLLLFLGLTLSLGIIISFWISAKIANPITKLTEFTRDFMQGKAQVPPAIRSSGEIAELNRQFGQMINSLEQSRQDVVRVAKLAVVGEMAASMAHEVRTPLGILRSSAQMLQREAALSDIGQEMIAFILSESQRLNDLVTTLLECARPKSPDFTEQDINAILEHSCMLVNAKADAKHMRISQQLSSDSCIARCDRDQLIQVFLNLLINAIQHSPNGGQLAVKTSLEDKVIHVSITDNGTGIPDALKNSVFDPFFTRREGGIGLGLTVVQQIILAHEGKIYITDNPTGGSCFHVVLPKNTAKTLH